MRYMIFLICGAIGVCHPDEKEAKLQPRCQYKRLNSVKTLFPTQIWHVFSRKWIVQHWNQSEFIGRPWIRFPLSSSVWPACFETIFWFGFLPCWVPRPGVDDGIRSGTGPCRTPAEGGTLGRCWTPSVPAYDRSSFGTPSAFSVSCLRWEKQALISNK